MPWSTIYALGNGDKVTTTFANEEARIVMGGYLYKAKSVVTPDASYDVLLGMEVLVAAQATIDLPTEQLIFEKDRAARVTEDMDV